jgi:hypothetical protein
VAPGFEGGLHINMANIHKKVPAILKELRDLYEVNGFSQSPLHQSIKLFADFVARARRHHLDNLLSEALLHYVIALELIFGDRDAIQKSVSSRVALLAYPDSGKSFLEQRKWIDKIYDMRSQYVHKGTEINAAESVEQLRAQCEKVFRCLLRLQVSEQTQDRLDNWLRELDYLTAGLMAGKQPTENQLYDAYIKARSENLT